MMHTHERARQYEHSLDHAVEFFSKAGSLFANTGTFYGGEETALSLFQKVWIVEQEVAMKLLFWLRDCRGGAGNRSGFRACMNWLAINAPAWVSANLHYIPTHGRWDDLEALFSTGLRNDAANLWASAIEAKDVLAAKWAKRDCRELQYAMKMNEAALRKTLAGIRRDHIVEAKMCAGQWGEITYPHVPSKAMSIYTNAFKEHDPGRFEAFKEKVEKGEEKIHAGVLFPHDCVRTAKNADRQTADLQFAALPNYMEGSNAKILVLCDTSGSMEVPVSGSVERIDVSQGLALYCSAKMPEKSPFYKKFIGFCSEGRFVDWNGMRLSQAIFDRKVFDEAVGHTRIDLALDLILKTAKFFNLPQEMMPNMLLIVSDMQFAEGTANTNNTVVANCMKEFQKAGYEAPKIVYWNVAGYAGSPATVKTPNTGLVSGFSPSVLKAIFAAEDFSPRAIMMKAIEKYEVVIPKE